MRKLAITHPIRALLPLAGYLVLTSCDGGSGHTRRVGGDAREIAPIAVQRAPVSEDATGGSFNVGRANEILPSTAPAVDIAGGRAKAMPAMQRRAAGSSTDVRNGALTMGTGAPLSSADPSGAMLIRHGQASVEVRRVDDAVTRVRQTATQFGGFVANTALRAGRDEQRAATLELRVPTSQFDQLVASLGALGRVESVSATVEDVADEYVDLRARANNARRMEARLVEMLATKTGKLSDVLTVEQELARVRGEIERYDARLNWLEKRTSLSTLELSLHEPIPLIDRQPGPGPIAESFGRAWENLVGVIAWCIASLGVLVPVAVVAFGIALVARRLWRPGAQGGVSGA
jgi:hypothetical protein